MRVTKLICRVAAAVLLATSHADAQFLPQPAGKGSTLVDRSGMALSDDFLGDQMRRLLTQDNGQPNVKNAIFMFNSCYGGGMLDELQLSLPSTVPYYLASASQHDQLAFGQFSRREALLKGLPNPQLYPINAFGSFSVEIILQMINNGSATIGNVIQNAIALDANGPLGMRLENPQRLFSIGGDTIPLRDPTASSRHAIIWGGLADQDGIFGDTKGIYDGLVSIWGNPATTPGTSISVLFGNGSTNAAGQALPAEWNAQPATAGQLMSVVDALRPVLNSNEQFVFYATDHGGLIEDSLSSAVPTQPPVFVLPGPAPTNFPITSSGTFEFGLQSSSTNTPAIKLEMVPAFPPPPGGVTGSLFIRLNDVTIGSITAAEFFTLTTIPFDESLLNISRDGSNTLGFLSSLNQPVLIPYIGLYSGGIEQARLVIPEPTAGAAVAVMLWFALRFRRPE